MHLLTIDRNGLLSLEGLCAIIASAIALLVLYIHCYASEHLTADLMAIGDIFYDSTWYRLPVKQQKLLVLPIQRATQEFRLKGSGLIDCSLAVFLSVKISISSFASI